MLFKTLVYLSTMTGPSLLPIYHTNALFILEALHHTPETQNIVYW